MFGIENENQKFICFTDSKAVAEEFASLLNAENVDEIHINALIEDYFYS